MHVYSSWQIDAYRPCVRNGNRRGFAVQVKLRRQDYLLLLLPALQGEIRQGLGEVQCFLELWRLASLVIIILMYSKTTFAQSQSLQSVMTGAGELLVGLDISYPESEENTIIIFIITFYHPAATDWRRAHRLQFFDSEGGQDHTQCRDD